MFINLFLQNDDGQITHNLNEPIGVLLGPANSLIRNELEMQQDVRRRGHSAHIEPTAVEADDDISEACSLLVLRERKTTPQSQQSNSRSATQSCAITKQKETFVSNSDSDENENIAGTVQENYLLDAQFSDDYLFKQMVSRGYLSHLQYSRRMPHSNFIYFPFPSLKGTESTCTRMYDS